MPFEGAAASIDHDDYVDDEAPTVKKKKKTAHLNKHKQSVFCDHLFLPLSCRLPRPKGRAVTRLSRFHPFLD